MSLSEIVITSNDPSARKSRGSQESADAHERIAHTKSDWYAKIMKLAKARDGYGVTLHEVCNAYGKKPNELSGRLSELVLKLKWLKKSGERRNGCAVLVVNQ